VTISIRATLFRCKTTHLALHVGSTAFTTSGINPSLDLASQSHVPPPPPPGVCASDVLASPYRASHNGADNAVRENDVFFALHALLLTCLTLAQVHPFFELYSHDSPTQKPA